MFGERGQIVRRPLRMDERSRRTLEERLSLRHEHRLDLEDVIEDGDSVVVTIHITARGKASGVEVDVRFHAHFKVRDDKVVYFFDHEDRAAALEAAGLSG